MKNHQIGMEARSKRAEHRFSASFELVFMLLAGGFRDSNGKQQALKWRGGLRRPVGDEIADLQNSAR